MTMNLLFSLLFFVSFNLYSQQIAVLKYKGGGDWYANPTSLPNLITFTNNNIHTGISKNIATINSDDEDIFNYPLVFVTGHGNIFFSSEDIENLRSYLISGGFMHISDNYGFDPYVRRELKKLFPKLELQEIPPAHPIFHQTYTFTNGLPKIHEHDKKPPKALGLFYKGRLLVFYDHESDLSDGWEDASVHNNPKEVREMALKMGANIIEYAFKN